MPRQHKKLRKIKDPENLDGFAYITNNAYEIYINVEKLWKDARKATKLKKNTVDSFARRFERTHTHELLHYILKKYYRAHVKYSFGEEQLVYGLTGDRWTKALSEYYQSKKNRW